MKTLARMMTVIGVGVAAVCQAQEMPPPDRGQPPQMERPPRNEGGGGEAAVLTASQQAQVKAILSKYDPASPDAVQARAIHESFREAGLRGGPAMGDAIKAAGFDPDKLRDLAPPPDRQQGENGGPRGGGSKDQPGGCSVGEGGPAAGAGAGGSLGGPGSAADRTRPGTQASRTERRGQGQYTLSQAMSDRAQLNTIAFSGLAFLTGDFGASTFMPPGKVCDYFGFQYMRDIDSAGKGHNPMFLSRVAANVMHILNKNQRKLFEDLATEQAGQFEQLALKRMPLIKAFHLESDGAYPQGTTGLSRDAVMRYVGDFFAYDAELSYRRAEVFGQVVASLTPDQKAYLAKMKFGDFNTWPEMDERAALKRPSSGVSKFYNVAYMTYASEFFSWYAGSVTADVYFCPERHGTYFGGFYMKDMPAMGKRNFDISTSVTGDSGETFLKLLSDAQRVNITSIVEKQRKLLAEIVTVREAISTELRKFLAGGQADKQKILALGRRYGELDGEMSWMYATAFGRVNRTLTAEQRAAMIKLRNLDGYQSAPAYLYSSPMQTLPAIPDTGFLFGKGEAPASSPGASSLPVQVKAPQPEGAVSPVPKASASTKGFSLRSPAVAEGAALPKEFTGDGESVTPPLEWSGVPEGTRSLAVIMHHVDPQGKVKWYWMLYNIPPETRALPRNVQGIGVVGNNSVNGRIGYAPPHSKGAGTKTYVFTLYALSAPLALEVPAAGASRDVLLKAMEGGKLGTAEMKVTYTRDTEAVGASTR